MSGLPRAASLMTPNQAAALQAVSAYFAKPGATAMRLYRNASNDVQAETDLLQSSTLCIR
jgi:hypothetical protein